MTLSRVVALLLLLPGCPPPQVSCQVPLGASLPRAPLLLEGATSFRLSVAGPACRLGDALSALPTLKDARGAIVPVTASLTQLDFTVEIELRTPPLGAGVYELQMFVEPTIAVVDLQVLVARDGAASVVKTTFPRPCLDPGRTLAGTTFCRQEQGFSAYSDAGVQTFPQAMSVAVTGDTVWMVNSSAVSRLEDRGAGQLVVTGTFNLLTTGVTLTTIDERTAFAGLSRFEARPDGGLRLLSAGFGQMPLLDANRVVQLEESGWCDEGARCQRGYKLIALDDDALWLAVPDLGSTLVLRQMNEVGSLERWARPLRDGDAGVTTRIPVPPGHQPLVRAFPFRITGAAPLLLFSLPDAGVTNLAVVRQGPDGPTATAFPEHAIVDVTREWLFAPGDNDNELKAHPLTP
ncbi:MAG: hypothetical protein ABTQ32_29615 [Myxococcaceae bacterium]